MKTAKTSAAIIASTLLIAGTLTPISAADAATTPSAASIARQANAAMARVQYAVIKETVTTSKTDRYTANGYVNKDSAYNKETHPYGSLEDLITGSQAYERASNDVTSIKLMGLNATQITALGSDWLTYDMADFTGSRNGDATPVPAAGTNFISTITYIASPSHLKAIIYKGQKAYRIKALSLYRSVTITISKSSHLVLEITSPGDVQTFSKYGIKTKAITAPANAKEIDNLG